MSDRFLDSMKARLDEAVPVFNLNLGTLYNQVVTTLKSVFATQNANLKVLNALPLSKPTLAPGGTTTNFKTTNTFNYILNGQIYTKAATDNIAAPGVNTTASQFRKVLVCIDAAGTVSTVAGAVTTVSQNAAVLPAPTANTCPVGWLELPVSFTSGTTAVTSGMCKDGFSAAALTGATDTSVLLS